MLGYGVGTAWYKRDNVDKYDNACEKAVESALKLGYRHLDAAESYKTEPEVGAAIKSSKLPRDKLFITTKVSTSIDDIPSALQASLSKLGLDYVDLFLIHSPFFAKDSPQPAALHQSKWAEMEKLKHRGLAKSIGVSNYLPEHLDYILETCSVCPAVNQIEFHPYLQHGNLLAYHRSKGIVTEAYSPLTPVTKASGGPVDDIVSALSKKYAVSPGEICLRWCIDQDVVPITTSAKEERLSDFLRAMAFKLTPREIQDINEAGRKKHYRGYWTEYYDGGDKR
ncbi:ketoreductase [Piedraia hortae CBS 480.64]|uniref:Ketoreductase n=1 Tax=Piedraia hortae CBS 480.64 TaxID=1314780 RepID=A0A6A7BTM4_9PEZI|nr:ketoreductase [Piedraia hortae CBS 480.64]